MTTYEERQLIRRTPRDLTPDDVDALMPGFLRRFERGSRRKCWLWQGVIDPEGYGIYNHKRAHRVAWVYETRKPLTDGLTIDHTCGQRACVNPHHLEPVTFSENSRRANIRRYGGRLLTEAERRERDNARVRVWYAENRERRAAWAAERVPCSVCLTNISRSSLALHKRRRHPELTTDRRDVTHDARRTPSEPP